MKTKRNRRVAQRVRTTREASLLKASQTFSEHLLEFRRRAFFVAASVGIGAALAYFVQQQIVMLMLKPAGDQQFIYTSPGGGLNFLVQICMFSGIMLSIPVIIYNLLKFVEPVVKQNSTKFILRMSVIAAVLAAAGACFGYFFGLPNALKFLSHQFTTDQVKALIAIQSYVGFVMKFILASALIFQAPLIMYIINRIKPLKPSKLLGMERWVVLGSFIIGALISPTPDARSMMLMAVPMILTYQVGIVIVWYVNRHATRHPKVIELLLNDQASREERLKLVEQAVKQKIVVPTPVDTTKTSPVVLTEPPIPIEPVLIEYAPAIRRRPEVMPAEASSVPTSMPKSVPTSRPARQSARTYRTDRVNRPTIPMEAVRPSYRSNGYLGQSSQQAVS